ncbi:MAG TPA: hypothetical protein VIW29_11550, partial [Polyangiaceae bacterium]
RLPPTRSSAGSSDITRSRVVPADVARHRVGADALPRSSVPVRPPADVRREPTVQPPRFGVEQQRVRPMPPPMREFMRTPAPAPRPRRP